jgi:hypothetical protein
MKNRFVSLALPVVFLLLMLPAVRADIASASMQQNLETAFMRALSDPAEFRNTGVFQLLGYSADEIAQIGRITPRPAAITVRAESSSEAGA